MIINLKAFNLVYLYFSSTITLTDELISQVRKVSKPDDEGDSAFVDSYNIDGMNHRSWGWVIEQDKNKGIYTIRTSYEAKGGGRIGKKAPRVPQLFKILSSIDDVLEFNCRAHFQYLKRTKPKPIVELPLKLVHAPNMPFDRIQGVHLIKLDGNKTKYDVALDILTNGTLIVNISFNYKAQIQETFGDDILREAVEISRLFVSKEQ